jgi:valyl-tRNA synthetase
MIDNESELPKAYDAKQNEKKWYDYWLANGYFTPKIDKSKKPFVLIQPPPNITGDLHLGHALTATLEDIMVRYHRMLGEPTLWLPGTDHAGIAAQVVVERALAKEGKTRQEIGREAFMKRMWEWVGNCRSHIANQHTRLGVSYDNTRAAFTLDPGPSLAVRTTFKHLYDKGLIYKGERITNWCPRCTTALSDLEVDHMDEKGKLWYIRYPFADDPSKFITVATTRPETILGDTGVAVNPEDERYKDVIGKELILPLVGRKIPIVADDVVGIDFGTGAVKTTPAHDPNDFEIGQRHNLPIINIFDEHACINENGGAYKGLSREDARIKIVKDLEDQGYLTKIEDHVHAVGHCQRCRTTIEPQVSSQWFVKIQPLAEPAIEAVKSGEITIVPERFTKVYLNWMENIRDWCISRQLWWGHRIPVWYCDDCKHMTCSIETPTECEACHSTHIHQDDDVLDTWFSSGLWPHSTLGWPNKTEDFEYFYPTSVMETAYDILFFWVARMIMMGIENTGKVPFHHVYLHGLIRDEKGEKMSKTKGNVIDPLVVINEYGADALRFSVISGITPGNDSKLGKTKIEAGRNFANKLYNAVRFVLRYTDENSTTAIDSSKLTLEDKWILSRLNKTTREMNQMLQDFQFGEAVRCIHDFIWGEICDWYIEIAKVRLNSNDANSPLPVLLTVIEQSLRLLHPIMPFITEELWQSIKKAANLTDTPSSVMITEYPQWNEAWDYSEDEEKMDTLTEIVRVLRNVRSEYDVDINKVIGATIYCGDLASTFTHYSKAVSVLAKADVSFEAKRNEETPGQAIVEVLPNAEIIIPMAKLFDLEAQLAKLNKELTEAVNEQARLEKHLKDESFLSRAPKQVIDKEQARLDAVLEKQEKLRDHIKSLEK